MKKSLLIGIVIIVSCSHLCAQSSKKQAEGSNGPKLVVGVVIDQMRWDYLYNFNHLFKSEGGFKRLMREGFSCDNTFIPYTPTYTAVGHSSIYTGSVPNISGIAGNDWYDKQKNKSVYCTEDDSVEAVGSNTDNGKMSPRNLLANTIGDELRLSNNFQSKVIGIALKDRGAILPAGHAANAAYWYDSKTGDFITSTYYMKELPEWVNQFNSRKMVDSLYNLNWNFLLNVDVYNKNCSADVNNYESRPFGDEQTGFPYNLARYAGKDYSKISTTPYGNTLTAEMAKAAIVSEHLGKGPVTDFLAISFSSTDYIGHSFGPNSWEHLDDYIRLDLELAKLFEFLDAHVGKKQYTLFLTADHGVAHVPGFLKEHNLPGGNYDLSISDLNKVLKAKFGRDRIVAASKNYQIFLNHPMLDSSDIDKADVIKFLIDYVGKNEAVSQVFELSKVLQTTMNATIRERIANGYNPTRSGDIQFVLKPGYLSGMRTGTTHGLWNPYDSHIPLLWYGWGIQQGRSSREVYMTDIAPTIAAMLNIQMPNGCVGKVIEEVTK